MPISRKVTTYGRLRPITHLNLDSEIPDENHDPGVSSSIKSVDSILNQVRSTLQSSKIKRLEEIKCDEVEKRLSIMRIDGANHSIELDELLSLLRIDRPGYFDDWCECIVKLYPFMKKIGESSFCEVYGCSRQSEAKLDLAIKVIPLQTSFKPTSNKSPEPVPLQKALHEARVQATINNLSKHRKYSIPSGYTGFNCARRITIVRGSYPKSLLSLWDKWNSPNKSENDRPDFYSDEDIFLIMEMEFGGQDLESFRVESAEQVYSIIMQLIYALELAETKLKFEHRDLHLGNILCKKTTRNDIRINSKRKLETHGVICSIIDFSLARLQPDEKSIIFSDLSNENWLFSGDESISPQYSVYRKMKSIVEKNDWSAFRPKSNIFWIEYILRTLLERIPVVKRKGPLYQELLELLEEKLNGVSSSSQLLDLLLS